MIKAFCTFLHGLIGTFSRWDEIICQLYLNVWTLLKMYVGAISIVGDQFCWLWSNFSVITVAQGKLHVNCYDVVVFFVHIFIQLASDFFLWLFHLTWCCCFLKGNNLLPGFRQPVVADCLLQKVMKHCRSWAAYLTINKSLSDVAVAVLPKTPQLIIRRCMFATYKNIIIQTLSLLSVCYRIDCHSLNTFCSGFATTISDC